jgi:hypothetical protein
MDKKTTFYDNRVLLAGFDTSAATFFLTLLPRKCRILLKFERRRLLRLTQDGLGISQVVSIASHRCAGTTGQPGRDQGDLRDSLSRSERSLKNPHHLQGQP